MKVKVKNIIALAVVKNSESWAEFAKSKVNIKTAYKLSVLFQELEPHLKAFEETRKERGIDGLEDLLNHEVEVNVEEIRMEELPEEISVAVMEVLMPFVSR